MEQLQKLESDGRRGGSGVRLGEVREIARKEGKVRGGSGDGSGSVSREPGQGRGRVRRGSGEEISTERVENIHEYLGKYSNAL